MVPFVLNVLQININCGQDQSCLFVKQSFVFMMFGVYFQAVEGRKQLVPSFKAVLEFYEKKSYVIEKSIWKCSE